MKFSKTLYIFYYHVADDECMACNLNLEKYFSISKKKISYQL